MIDQRPPGPLTIDADDRVSGLLHPAEYERWGEDPLTGEWVVLSCIRLPTRPDVFMRGGTGHIVYGTHPSFSDRVDDVIAYYDGLEALPFVDVDEISFADDGARIVGHLHDPTWDYAREWVTYGRPSCDWRQVDHTLTLVGAILVYEPGYGITPTPANIGPT